MFVGFIWKVVSDELSYILHTLIILVSETGGVQVYFEKRSENTSMCVDFWYYTMDGTSQLYFKIKLFWK